MPGWPGFAGFASIGGDGPSVPLPGDLALRSACEREDREKIKSSSYAVAGLACTPRLIVGGGGGRWRKLQLEGEPLVAGKLGLRGDTADAAAEVTPGRVPAEVDVRFPPVVVRLDRDRRLREREQRLTATDLAAHAQIPSCSSPAFFVVLGGVTGV